MMPLFRRRPDPAPAPPPAPPPSAPMTRTPAPRPVTARPKDVDWSDIANVRAEWPISKLDPNSDLRKWEQGLALCGIDDYASMMQCATLMSSALAHSLYGEGIVHGDDLVNTVGNTLFASLGSPPDMKTFADSAQRAARLVLTLIRENGWQPAHMGGKGLFDRLVMDKGNYMLLCQAIAPAGRPWEGDLKAFFGVPPQVLVAPLPDAAAKEQDKVVDRMFETLQKAKAGDPASEHHMRGMSLWGNGHPEEAMAELSEAAKLGDVPAMKNAGDLAKEMGWTDQSLFWFESAANAGNPPSMWNMAVFSLNAGDLATAAHWYKRSAEAGLADGYAALTQMARDRKDDAAERKWSKLGAEMGQTFCMSIYAFVLALDTEDNGDVPTLRRAREFAQQAAARGDSASMSLAAILNFRLGDHDRGRRYVQMVVDSGDPDEIGSLRRHGLL